MESYQILVIIGAILGLLITLSAFGAIYFLQSIFDKNLESPRAKDYQYVYYSMPIAVAFYIASLAVTFGSKNLKFVGIFLIISSVSILILTSFYGVLGFALLLPAGIIALRKRNKPVGLTTST